MTCTFSLQNLLILYFLTILTLSVFCKKKEQSETSEKDKWKKKDIRDYSEADMERLYDQWEEADEDELPEDELPEWKREPSKVDLSKLDTSDPEKLIQATKKGKTLMMFASVSGNPTQEETEKITQIWQGSLFNANIETQRYMVGENRAIFMLKDGAMAWEVKDFLVQQDRCEEVTIEGKSYPGKGATSKSEKKVKEKKGSKKSQETSNTDSQKKSKKNKTEL